MQALIVVLAIAGGLFVWISGGALPDVVPDHYDIAGTPSGRMSRDGYLVLMLALVVVAPLLVAFSGRLLTVAPALVNFPNKDYWLAPERRADTVRSFAAWSSGFAVALLLFVCELHWLVVQANASAEKRLPTAPFIASLALFLVATGVWLVLLHRRFGKPA